MHRKNVFCIIYGSAMINASVSFFHISRLLNVEGITYETNSVIATYIQDIYETRCQTQQV